MYDVSNAKLHRELPLVSKAGPSRSGRTHHRNMESLRTDRGVYDAFVLCQPEAGFRVELDIRYRLE